MSKLPTAFLRLPFVISIGNSMICSDIWHKYHEGYFEIVRQFWNITSYIYAKNHVQIMLLLGYTTTHKRFVIFTCRYFKLSWNTTALSQSNCKHFSRSSINKETDQLKPFGWKLALYEWCFDFWTLYLSFHLCLHARAFMYSVISLCIIWYSLRSKRFFTSGKFTA